MFSVENKLLSLQRYPQTEAHNAEGRGRHILQIRRLLRFVLDVLKSRKFLGTVRNMATVDAQRDVLYTYLNLLVYYCILKEGCNFTYLAWASVLLVHLYRAMREPQNVERVTARTPTSFYICSTYLNCNFLSAWELPEIKTQLFYYGMPFII